MRARIHLAFWITIAPFLSFGATAHLPAGAAGTATWTGNGGDANWMTGANWVGGAAPSAGDDLVFPAGALQLSNSNNFPGSTSFHSIAFTGAAGGYTLGGNPITIINGAISTATTATDTINLSLSIIASNNVTTSASGTLVLGGVISGTGSLQKSGVGLLRVLGSNTYTGQTIVDGGTLRVESVTALGAHDGTTNTETAVNSGATLEFLSLAVDNELLAIVGTGQSGGGALAAAAGAAPILNCPIVVFADASVRSVSPSILVLQGPIVGPGKLFLSGSGDVTLESASNVLTGGLGWSAGQTTTLRIGANGAVPDTVSLDIPGGAIFDLANLADHIAGLSGTGTVTLGTGTLQVNPPATSTFSGNVTGTGTFNKVGSGTQILTGTLSNTGIDDIQGGTLVVDGTVVGQIVVEVTATLMGTGTVGGLSVNGFLSPGDSPGVLTSSLPVTFSPSGFSLLNLEINGTTPGSQYDQLRVTGQLSLNGSLAGSMGFTPAPGTQFMIINHLGPGAVLGTFTGLPQGSTVVIGPESFTIDYNGGDGNDVVLTALAFVPVMPGPTMVLLFVLLTGLGVLGGRRWQRRSA